MTSRQKTRLRIYAALIAMSVSFALPVRAQEDGTIVIPPSSIESPQDGGIRAHANMILNLHGITPGSASIAPASFNYGQHFYGDPPVNHTFVLTNAGTATLNIHSFGQLYEPFQYSGTTCGATLGAGLSCNITLTFVPGEAPQGTSTATFYVYDNATSSPQTVSLTGKMSCPGGECP